MLASTSMAEEWSALEDVQITTEHVQKRLALVSDDLWVISACVDRVLDDVGVQRALLDLGISRSRHVVDRCEDTIALSSHLDRGDLDGLRSHFDSTPADAQLCHLRSVLLRRLDRLNTYVELADAFSKNTDLEQSEDDIEEWEDDPWADQASSSGSKPNIQRSPPPITLSEFVQNDLLWSACELCSMGEIDAVELLMKTFTSDLWPARFRILESLPEYIHPSTCVNILPSFDHATNAEYIPKGEILRPEQDFSETQNIQELVATSTKILEFITDRSNEVLFTPVHVPLTASELTAWYKKRVNHVLLKTGMIDISLALVQQGAAHGVPSLDELGEELSLLSRLVYDASQGKELTDDWSLSRWCSMDPMSIVHAYLSHSTPDCLASDIRRLVMPYLYVLEARAERAGQPNSTLPTDMLYNFILTSSLDKVAAIFDVSKPTLPTSQRIIQNDEDMARLALACLYGSKSLDEWPIMSSIFECLPVWEVPKDEDNNEDTADTTVASLGAFVTPTTSQLQVTPEDLYIFFKPLPFASLSQALDILDVHLESGEILWRWSVPAPLRWFLQSSGDVNEQRVWANRLVRKAGGKRDRLNGTEDWEWLLKDMLKLTGGNCGARGAFCLLSRQEIMTIFLSGLLSSGNFDIAKSMLYGPRRTIVLPDETVEQICLACSRELYDNASSGNYKFGDMKLAYECLDVPKPSKTLTQEKEFIEATSRIASFNVLSSPGLPISPIEVRLTKDRLSLISRVLSSTNDAYKHTEVVLDLCYKLGFRDDTVAEIKVLAMLADTALQAEDFSVAYEHAERMIGALTRLKNADRLEVETRKVTDATEVCWIACFQLGRQPEFPDLAKKMTLLGHALELCPSDRLHDVLTAWRKLQVENIQAREEKLEERQNGQFAPSRRQPEFVPRNVASSLRARLQDLHMPSPPLLSTPDAAALASRTFKSVAANFSFARGRTHTSEIEDKSSVWSEGSRRTDGHDVSAQASRALSKGIGWLIGADDEL